MYSQRQSNSTLEEIGLVWNRGMHVCVQQVDAGEKGALIRDRAIVSPNQSASCSLQHGHGPPPQLTQRVQASDAGGYDAGRRITRDTTHAPFDGRDISFLFGNSETTST